MIVNINKTAQSRFITEDAQEDERIRELRKNVTLVYETSLEASALFAGRYRKVSELGGGGMGVVYLMEDTQLDNERVAIKMLPPYLSDNEDALSLIAREAKNAQKLRHEHIVCVRHYAKYNKTPYIVMDYIAGTTLRQEMLKGPIPEETVIALLKPIAEALDYAHRPISGRGCILHRDIKPDNIIFQRYDDGTVHPVILDFGISKATEDMAVMTRFRRTPGYTPPEKMLDAQSVSTVAHDIFSFAVTAYECLTCRLPFGKEEDAATLERIRRGEFVRIVNASPFVQAVERGLSFLPEDRPKSCSEFFAQPQRVEIPLRREMPDPDVNAGFWEQSVALPEEEPDTLSTPFAAPDREPTRNAPFRKEEPQSYSTPDRGSGQGSRIAVPLHAPEFIAKTETLVALCSDYRVLLAESATLHRDDPDLADLFRVIQAQLRDVIEAEETEAVDAFLLTYLFDRIRESRRKFARAHRGAAFFMEHRRRNVAWRIADATDEPWIAAMKRSIEL